MQISGVITDKWRNEDYGARSSSHVWFRVDRCAGTFFGITQFGCHLNGFVRHSPRPDDVSLWMALRHPSRLFYPRKWDTIVGGGLPVDITPYQNMLKEAQEERNIRQFAIKYSGVRYSPEKSCSKI